MKKGEKRGVSHRENQGQFNGSYRTGLEIKRRSELRITQECEGIKKSKSVSHYIKPPPTDAELKEQFMSPSALALKRKTPLFNPIPL